MKTRDLLAYADDQIQILALDHTGPLGTEYVAACKGEQRGTVYIGDGHGEMEVCRTFEEIDAVLQGYVDWVNESVI